jgi:hypothetical protein
MFEGMRPTAEVAPAPGFYERVRSHIEQASRQSIWMPLIYSHFPKRFVGACLAASAVLLGYMAAAEWYTQHPGRIVNSGGANPVARFTVDPKQQRDAVLVQIVTYSRQN